MPAVAGASTCAPPAAPTLGIGVLGCADIALRRFLPAVVQSERSRLVAIASRDVNKASAVAHRFACAAADYMELLRSDQVDLIYLPLPNHLHEEWAIKALDHGKHVLCEKPLGLSTDSVNRMLEAASRNGVLLYENLMYLHHPQHGRIREILATGGIGTVTGLHSVFTFPGPASGNFRLDPQQGGGAFHDLNRYPLSAARYFLRGDIGAIIRCHASWQEEMIISMEAEARTTENERFSFAIGFGQPYRSFYEINGTKGTLRLERAFTPPVDHECRMEFRCNGGDETILMQAHDHFRLTIDHVAELIAGGSDFSVEHERARALAHVADRFLQRTRSEKGPS